jgi:hypothetical protein
VTNGFWGQPYIAMDSGNNTWISYAIGSGLAIVPALVKHIAGAAWSTWQTPILDSSASVYSGPSSASLDGIPLATNGTIVYIAYAPDVGSYNVVWATLGSSHRRVANARTQQSLGIREICLRLCHSKGARRFQVS